MVSLSSLEFLVQQLLGIFGCTGTCSTISTRSATDVKKTTLRIAANRRKSFLHNKESIFPDFECLLGQIHPSTMTQHFSPLRSLLLSFLALLFFVTFFHCLRCLPAYVPWGFVLHFFLCFPQNMRIPYILAQRYT